MTRTIAVTPNTKHFFIAATLLLLLSLACGVGGLALWNADPERIEGGMASKGDVRFTAGGLIVVAILSIAASVSGFLRTRTAWPLGSIAACTFVIGGFLGNYLIFSSLRPVHTGTNTAIAAIIIWLLWKGARSATVPHY